jgi:hypothetical protein
MAEDLTRMPPEGTADTAHATESVDAEKAPPLIVSRPSRPQDREFHAGRFRIVYALLAILLGAAVGSFIVLFGRDDGTSTDNWSAWKAPAGSGVLRAQAIASHVGKQYRLPSGRELVAVIPRVPPAIQTSSDPVGISHIVYAPTNSPEDFSVYPTDNSAEYLLCGVGSRNCAIGEGQATVGRARLLHRESLELALYTFKYVDGVDSVVAVQPPRAGQNPTYALFFRKDDFKDALARPLDRTLAGGGPLSVDEFTPGEQNAVARMVNPHLFKFSYEQAADGSALLVLQPPTA